jgi:phosphatidylinositol glycan class B
MLEIYKSPYRLLLFGGLLAFLITAYFSDGHFHPDEHFQILEFANYKRGITPGDALPWEFGDKIRPSLQPTLACLVLETFQFIGIESPFTQIFLLRLITAFLAWLVIAKLSLLVVDQFRSEISKKIFLGFSLLLWFVPFISVRFSSENYASITFFAAVYLILKYFKDHQKQSIIQIVFAGVLLGLSFFFRFQMAFALMGLGLWLLFVQIANVKTILWLVFPALAVMLFCVGLDWSFYGEKVLTPFNYFYQNLTLNKAAEFGETPWWDYFKLLIEKGIPPFSILLLVFLFWGGFQQKRSVFLWVFVPFLLGHMAVGHKELRFMFPVVFAFIYLVAIGMDAFLARYSYKKSWKWLIVPAIAINFLALTAEAITPQQTIINYYKFLYKESNKVPLVLICKNEDIYKVVGNQIYFYKAPKLKTVICKDDTEIQAYLDTANIKRLFLLELDFSADVNFKNYSDQKVYFAYPQWIKAFNFNDWIIRSRIYTIHELRAKS